jgi:hypothetical protein
MSRQAGTTRCDLRLDPSFRFWNYAAIAALLVSGVIWLVADQLKTSDNGEIWQAIAANTLMLHGMTAMLALILFGAMIPVHVQRSWRAGKNRISGSVMAATNAILIATASGLYYAGSDELRSLVADMHIGAGLALPVLIVTHIMLGRRARTSIRQAHSTAEISGGWHSATFSGDTGSQRPTRPQGSTEVGPATSARAAGRRA